MEKEKGKTMSPLKKKKKKKNKGNDKEKSWLNPSFVFLQGEPLFTML